MWLAVTVVMAVIVPVFMSVVVVMIVAVSIMFMPMAVVVFLVIPMCMAMIAAMVVPMIDIAQRKSSDILLHDGRWHVYHRRSSCVTKRWLHGGSLTARSSKRVSARVSSVQQAIRVEPIHVLNGIVWVQTAPGSERPAE